MLWAKFPWSSAFTISVWIPKTVYVETISLFGSPTLHIDLGKVIKEIRNGSYLLLIAGTLNVEIRRKIATDKTKGRYFFRYFNTNGA